MKVAGIGCRKNAGAGEIIAAVEAALNGHGLEPSVLGTLAAPIFKEEEPGILAAAYALGLPLVFVSAEQLEGASTRGMSHSALSLKVSGAASASEAAALAAAGEGSRLLGPRIAIGNVTCAIAESGETA